MSLAEALYKEQNEFSDIPPLWLDLSFIITVSIIHFIYAFKFTRFSIAFLKAKCEEKASRTKWTESKLYLHAILSYSVTNTNNTQHHIYTKLWSQLSIIRNIIKLLMILCCIISLVLYITLILNITFEFFIVCFVNYKVGAFLALIVLPFWLFVNYEVIRYIIYGTLVTWKINIDVIADDISYQQKQKAIQKYTFKDITNDTNSDNNDDSDKQPSSFKAFFSPLFMAFHWRLLVTIWCVVATMIAMPTIAFALEAKGMAVSDSYFSKIFLRYMLIAMMLWLFIYFWLLAVIPAFYGKFSTIFIFNDVIMNDNDDNENTTFNQIKQTILRVFCLMNAFGLEETNKCWKIYKIVYCSLLLTTGISLIIISPFISNALLVFIGIVNLLYYAMNILLNNKPRGIHYLWQCDMKALELNWFEYVKYDNEAENITQADSKSVTSDVDESTITYLSTMTALKHHQIQRLLTTNLTVNNFDTEPNVVATVEQANLMDEQKELFSPISDNEDMRDALYGSDEDDDEHVLKSEEEVVSLFTSLYMKVYNERRRLFTERATMNCCNRFCLDFKIIINYFYTIFKLYKVYWLLILPYNYEITPLSGICGKSIEERIIRFNYNKHSCFQTLCSGMKCCWDSIKALLFCCIFFVIIVAVIYLSVSYSSEIDNIYNEINPYGNIANGTVVIGNDTVNVPLYYHTKDTYPICSLNWNGNLSIFDVTSVARMSYEIQPDSSQQLMSIQELMCMYFDRIIPNESINTSNCSWQVLYISRTSPVFMHLRHGQDKVDVISIKGTKNAAEMLQDISLFNQVALLQTASFIIPITTIFPQSFLIRTIYMISLFEQLIDQDVRSRYDNPVFEYAYNYLLTTSNTVNSFYFMGHSLGGGVSQAVAAQLYRLSVLQDIRNEQDEVLEPEIKSFSMSAPGLTLSSRKFSIDPMDLYETATLLKPRYDIVSSIDIAGGLIQNIECHRDTFYACHKTIPQICELMNRCNAYKGNNPDLIAAVCIDMNGMGVQYMKYQNYSAFIKEYHEYWKEREGNEEGEEEA